MYEHFQVCFILIGHRDWESASSMLGAAMATSSSDLPSTGGQVLGVLITCLFWVAEVISLFSTIPFTGLLSVYSIQAGAAAAAEGLSKGRVIFAMKDLEDHQIQSPGGFIETWLQPS